jgi:uncharacterized protein YndB with AHSA1/START domain
MMELYHETLTFQRPFPVPAARLFEAFRNPREREVWSAPDDNTAIEIVECDLRTGGHEKGLCGSKGNMNWSMDVVYHLVETDRLITFTEELREGDRILTIALITIDIVPTDEGCTLKLTDQITSFVGQGGVSGHRDGYSKALDNLATMLKPA